MTKLAPPRIGVESIARDRLVALLKQASHARLALMTGGAGFGKTTLLAQWRKEVMGRGSNSVWLTLGRGDKGLPLLHAYLVAGLQGSGIQVEDGSGLAGFGDEELSPAGLGASLVNAITQAGRELYVFIDDYHHVDDARADELIQFLAEHGPHGLFLVIASRTRPSLKLGKLRVMQQVLELDAQALLFDDQETAAFLNTSLRRPCSHGAMRLIHEHTGGWPAGLRLLALAWKTRAPSHAELRTLLNKTADLDTYLAEEVLAHLPPHVVDFAERLSLCRRFCPELAAAVAGVDDASALIQGLLQGNLFVVQLEAVDSHDWYRFHALFSQCLKDRLERRAPDLARKIHLQACRWYASKGDLGEAVRHAHGADDLDLAIELVEQAGLVGAMNNLGPLLYWMENLPHGLLFSHPRLLLQGCVALMLTARIAKAQEWLEKLMAADSSHDPDIALQARIVQAAVALNRDDGARAIEVLEPIQEAVSSMPLWRSLNAVVLETAYAVSGRYAEARQLHLQLAASGGRGDAVTLLEHAAYALGFLIEGRVAEAARIASATLARAQASQGRGSVAANAAAAFAADAYHEQGRMDEAREALAERLELYKYSSPEPMIRAAVCHGRLLQLQQPPRVALAFLAKTEEHFRMLGLRRGVVHMLAEQAALALSEGDRRTAARLQERIDDMAGQAAAEGAPDIFRAEIPAMAALSRGRLAIALYTPQEALAHLAQAGQYAAETGRGRMSVQAGLLEAEAFDLLGREPETLRSLASALELGHRLGLAQTLLQARRIWFPRLDQLRAQGHLPAGILGYVSALTADPAGEGPPETSSPQAHAAGADSASADLTPRELDVLKLMRQSMPNKRIALTLGLSLQTIKWNIKNIFAKLQVTSRYEAIAWAQKHEVGHGGQGENG